MIDINKHLDLVHYTIKKYYGGRGGVHYTAKMSGIEYDDMFQIGCMGLMEAIDTHDESKSKFSYYAVMMIHFKIGKEIRRLSGLIKTPINMKEYVKVTNLHTLAEGNEEDERLEYEPSVCYEEDIVHDILFDEIKASLREKDKELLQLVTKGYNPRQISKFWGVSHQAVFARLKRIRKEIREKWNLSERQTAS